MQTLAKQLLSLQRRLTAGAISESEYKQAVRERSGALVRQSGRLIRRGLAAPVYSEHRGVISKVRMVSGEQPETANIGAHNPSLAGRTLAQFKAAPEVRLRDAQIKLCRALGLSGMVKVVKGAVK